LLVLHSTRLLLLLGGLLWVWGSVVPVCPALHLLGHLLLLQDLQA
jgi:hypothetical protein